MKARKSSSGCRLTQMPTVSHWTQSGLMGYKGKRQKSPALPWMRLPRIPPFGPRPGTDADNPVALFLRSWPLLRTMCRLLLAALLCAAFAHPGDAPAAGGEDPGTLLLLLPADSEPPDTFRSDFTHSAEGWSPVSGAWTLRDGYYASSGPVGDTGWSSIVSDEAYATLKVCARFKRSGCEGCNNSLLVRGEPEPLSDSDSWDDYYSFALNNNGSYMVGKKVNGEFTSLTGDWLTTAYAVVGGWNTLCAIANGSSFKFVLNGNNLYTFTDANFASGKMGVAFYGKQSDDELLLDWVEWTTNPENFRQPERTLLSSRGPVPPEAEQQEPAVVPGR